MSILDKFKENLAPEEFTQLEESIKELIEEKAKIRAEMIVTEETARIEALAEEFTEREVVARLDETVKKLEAEYEEKTAKFKEAAVKKIEEHAEQYVAEQVDAIVSEKLEALDSEYETAIAELEETIITDLDRFLESEITNKISDSLLEGIAINETFSPIVNGIMSLFESNYVSLDTESKAIVNAAEEEAKKLKEKLTESYTTKLSLQSKIDELQTSLLIASRTDGMTSSQKSKVKAMFEGKSYDEVTKKISTFIELLEEKENLTESEDQVVNDDIFLNEDDKENETEDETDTKEELTEDVKVDDYQIRLEKINYYL